MGVGGGRRRGRRTGQEIGGGGLAQIGEMGVSQKGVVHLEVGEGMVSRGWGGWFLLYWRGMGWEHTDVIGGKGDGVDRWDR